MPGRVHPRSAAAEYGLSPAAAPEGSGPSVMEAVANEDNATLGTRGGTGAERSGASGGASRSEASELPGQFEGTTVQLEGIAGQFDRSAGRSEATVRQYTRRKLVEFIEGKGGDYSITEIVAEFDNPSKFYSTDYLEILRQLIDDGEVPVYND